MKVLQLIDSLHAGGAERVAVNFANALVSKTDGSFICATREEGVLKNSINKSVSYLFLNKIHTLDIRAIKRLHNYVRINDIDIIHAHSSSFFLATLVKFLNNTKIKWYYFRRFVASSGNTKDGLNTLAFSISIVA